jgi:hypothetical protein
MELAKESKENAVEVEGDIGKDEEQVGTIIIDENSSGRSALRPQPSLDPNDPLVNLPSRPHSFLLTS